MKLSELYKERIEAIPELTRRELVDAVGSATVYAIQHDVPRKFRKSTLHKLAELWKCSVGDIQACMAEMPNPLRKEAERPEGKAGLIKKERTQMKELPRDEELPFMELPTPAPDFLTEKVDGYYDETEQTAEEFKQELRGLFIKLASDIQVFDTQMHELTSVFGKAVLDRIAENEAHDGNT